MNKEEQDIAKKQAIAKAIEERYPPTPKLPCFRYFPKESMESIISHEDFWPKQHSKKGIVNKWNLKELSKQ